MPWSPSDATRKTKKATTAKLRDTWAAVANATLQRSGNEGLAVREANAVVRDQADRAKRKRKGK